MTIIIPSCDDDPEPPDEQACCRLVSPEEGEKNVFSLHPRPILTLLHKVRLRTSSKFKTRPPCGDLRSLISIHAVRDDRYLRRRLTIVWRNTLYSLECSPLSGELRSDEIVDAAQAKPQNQGLSVCRSIPPSDPSVAIDKEKSECTSTTTEENTLNTTFCVPIIIVTPPVTGDDTSIAYNTIPTPQDSAFGVYLTVPDSDQFAKGWCKAHSGLNGATERRVGTASCIGSRTSTARHKLHPMTVSRRWTLFEDKDQEIDLGPTWSG